MINQSPHTVIENEKSVPFSYFILYTVECPMFNFLVDIRNPFFGENHGFAFFGKCPDFHLSSSMMRSKTAEYDFRIQHDYLGRWRSRSIVFVRKSINCSCPKWRRLKISCHMGCITWCCWHSGRSSAAGRALSQMKNIVRRQFCRLCLIRLLTGKRKQQSYSARIHVDNLAVEKIMKWCYFSLRRPTEGIGLPVGCWISN